MTSFLICYPDVPINAMITVPTAAADYDADHWFASLAAGPRHGYARLIGNASSVSLYYDLGTGNARTVDHFILGGCKALKTNGVTQATLQGSSNGSTWVDQLGTASGFQTRTFDGPDDSDVIFVPGYNDQYSATLASYRYWKATIAGGTHPFPFSKLYFGAAFDMGKEPDYYDLEVTTERDSDTWRYQRGQVLMTKAFYPRHRVTIEWDGVSDAKAAEFEQKILKSPFRDGVFLYTNTYLDPLYDNRLIHCKTVDDACSVTRQKQDWVNVVAVFEEWG